MSLDKALIKGKGGRVSKISNAQRKELANCGVGKAVVLRRLGIDALEEMCAVYTGTSKYIKSEMIVDESGNVIGGISDEKKIDVLKDIVSYCYPKVRGVEVSGTVKNESGVTVIVKHMGFGVKEAVKGEIIDVETKKAISDEIIKEAIEG